MAAEKHNQAFDNAGSNNGNSFIKWNCCGCLKKWKDFKKRVIIIGESDVSVCQIPDDGDVDPTLYLQRQAQRKAGQVRAPFYAYVGELDATLENMINIMKGAPLLAELPVEYWGMDPAQPVTLEVMLGALEKVCARTGAQLGTLPEKVTIRTGSVSRTRNGIKGDHPDTWNRDIVGDSPTLSQLHEGTKLDVLLLDGDLIPVLSQRAATMIVAQCAMWLDTKKMYEQAKAKYSAKAQTPKTIFRLHQLALEAREVFKPGRFEDPDYQPNLSNL